MEKIKHDIKNNTKNANLNILCKETSSISYPLAHANLSNITRHKNY